MEAWNLMVQTAKNAADDASYFRLQGKTPDGEDDLEQEALLDIDDFIDYMLINQYGGNTDWDHHNWYRNLQGQVVTNPSVGIYIRNGKKIVIR